MSDRGWNYVVRTKSDAASGVEATRPETMTVYELDTAFIDTRLLDPHGNQIMRQEQKTPIGFVRFTKVIGNVGAI